MEDFTVQTSDVKLKNIFISKDLYTHDFRWENVIFWGCTALPNNELQKHILVTDETYLPQSAV